MAVRDNIFAIGDCTWTKFKEEKNIVSMMAMAGHVGNNIKSLDRGENMTSKNMGEKLALIAYISLGPEFGIMINNDEVVASREVGL